MPAAVLYKGKHLKQISITNVGMDDPEYGGGGGCMVVFFR